jgi:fluoroacetyl-CoA thioesterase
VALPTGLQGRATLSVREEDSAIALRSGDVPVLATPRLIALCEEACCRAVDGMLGEGVTTVGMRVQFDHLSPSRIGATVTAEATLAQAEGRRLTFTVSAADAAGLVGAGRMTRVVVEVEPFLKRAG